MLSFLRWHKIFKDFYKRNRFIFYNINGHACLSLCQTKCTHREKNQQNTAVDNPSPNEHPHSIFKSIHLTNTGDMSRETNSIRAKRAQIDKIPHIIFIISEKKKHFYHFEKYVCTEHLHVTEHHLSNVICISWIKKKKNRTRNELNLSQNAKRSRPREKIKQKSAQNQSRAACRHPSRA